MNKHTPGSYLTPEQVLQLNEKHGWFECKDAQGDVSRAFAQDAIAMHERIRAAAPDLLEVVAAFIKYDDGDYIDGTEMMFLYDDAINKARAAFAKATGEAK